MKSIYELILDVLDQVKFETPEDIQKRKFIRMSSLLFPKECENFWAWVEGASIKELDLYIASDGYFAAFLDMMQTREKNKKLIDTGELKQRAYSPSFSYKFAITANSEYQLRQQLMFDALEEDKALSRIIDEIIDEIAANQ
jgi:hypothetical protein